MKKLLFSLFILLFLSSPVFAGMGMYATDPLNPPAGDLTVTGNITATAAAPTELITWTDAGWNEDGATWTFAASTLTHVTGNVTAVTGTVTGALAIGTTYRVIITGTGGVATATYTLGGCTGTTIPASGAIAIEDYITATVDSELVITPANTCTVALTLVSVKALTDATGDATIQGNLNVYSPAYFYGPILARYGTSTYPAYGFAGAPSVGFNGESGNLDMVIDGAVRVRFYSNGRVLFNTTAAYLNFDSGATFGDSAGGDIILTPAGTGQVKNTAANITAGSGTGITVNSTGNLNRQVYQVTTTYDAYTDIDTTKGIVICTLPAKTKIVGFYADSTETFKGGAVNAATLEVGITAEGAAQILAPLDIWTATATYGLADANMGTGMTRAASIQGGYLPSWTGTTAIYATIDTTAGNLNALTTGSVTFYIETERF